MKRNMELIRQLALHTESMNDSFQLSDITIKGYTAQQLLYHCILMVEGGLIDAEIIEELSGDGDAFVQRLTWSGHDFLDAARDESVWNRTLKTVKESVTSVAFDSFTDLLKATAKALVAKAISVGL